MPLTVGSRLGVYEITAAIGAGGMGEVYRARDTKLGRAVALKVLPADFTGDPDRLARFRREAQVLASLNHPNVGAIYGLEDAGSTPALVLELVEGPTLADRIAAGPMPPAEALPIARQIAEAIEYAHERGVIHRDLKPANVKLDAEQRVKVLDFGLAKAMAEDPSSSGGDPSRSPTMTSIGSVAGLIIGTAAYMSPEQARGATVDRRADIWAFGAVLFEMLTGRRAFEGETISDTLAAVLRAPVEWGLVPAGVPRAVVRLLERCLERDPKKRLRDIGEARVILESLADDPLEAVDAGAVVAPARNRLLSALPWAVAALAVVGIVSILFLRAAPAPALVVRFEIPPVEGLSRVAWPRISPDGRAIAFLGQPASGKSSVWIRRIDAFEPYVLKGTEGAHRPFWSPDSRHVAFYKDGELLRVPVEGGPSQSICQVKSGADGSWGAGGVIVFDGPGDEPIRSCNASGGSTVDPSGPAEGAVRQSWPVFLPDGRHYLFLVGSSAVAAQQTIHVATIDQAGSKALVPTDSRVEYGSGQLVYMLQNTLVAQAFDEERLETVGDPIPLASNVLSDRAPGFSVSSNGVLTYATGGVTPSGRLVWVDRSGREVEAVGPPDEYRDLALSPDGTRLAYGLVDGGYGEDIWIRDLKRGVTMRLTSDPRWEGMPVWSPDGTRVLFSSCDASQCVVAMKSATGTGPKETLYSNAPERFAPESWSRDGRFVTITRYSPQRTRRDVDVLTLDGTPVASVFTGEDDATESNAQFSPDGKWIAYQSDESGRYEVYVQPYPSTGAKWAISNGGGRSAHWRADGRELFFQNLEGTIFAAPVTSGTTLEVGIPKELFTRTMHNLGSVRNRWVVSADGERFLMNLAPERPATSAFSVVLNWVEGLAGE